jgi:putative endonuclease
MQIKLWKTRKASLSLPFRLFITFDLMIEKPYTLYILVCGDGAYYTGITSNLNKRMEAHQLAKPGSANSTRRWTKYHQPVQLVFTYEGLENYHIALKVERYVKSLTRAYKELLISGDLKRLNLLKGIHRMHVATYVSANTSGHFSQIQHPYTVRTQT